MDKSPGLSSHSLTQILSLSLFLSTLFSRPSFLDRLLSHSMLLNVALDTCKGHIRTHVVCTMDDSPGLSSHSLTQNLSLSLCSSRLSSLDPLLSTVFSPFDPLFCPAFWILIVAVA